MDQVLGYRLTASARHAAGRCSAACLAVVLVLPLAACGDTGHRAGGSPEAGQSTLRTSATEARPSGTVAPSARRGKVPKRRNPALWPYPAKAIWNHPLGSRARFVPTQISAPTAKTLAVEEDLIIVSPNALPRPVFYSPAGWQPGTNRCDSRTARILITGMPVDLTWFTDPGYYGVSPNQSAAIVLRSGRLVETQPFHACADGTLVSKAAPESWRKSNIKTGGTAKNVGGGAHGGSGMTAFGGTIRLGEWVPGGVIRHALKIEIDAAKYLSPTSNGYRWPAHHADQYATFHYKGTNPALRMGALLALPSTFRIKRLHSKAARVIALALKRYGAYVVDDTKRDAIAFATEWGPRGRVIDEFEDDWGFRLDGNVSDTDGKQHHFLKDMASIYGKLAVADDNGRRHVGGHGERVAPWAPPMRKWPQH